MSTTTPDRATDVESKPHSLLEEKSDLNSYPHSTQGIEEAGAQPKTVEEYATGKRLIPVVVALVLAVLLIALDLTIVGVAIPRITDEFKGLSQISWYGSAYFMTFGGLQPASGKLYKYFALKTCFLTSISIFMVGSLLCGVAPGSTTLIVGRAIAGVGAAGVGTGAYTIVALSAEPKLRPALIGMMGAVYGISSVLGPILGGVFTDRASWRWCFYVNLPVGGISLLMTLLFFKTPPQGRPTKATWREKLLQMDFFGVALVMGAIISFILAMEYGGQKKPWGSSTVVGLLVGCALMVIAFGFWEFWLDERAMLQRRLFRQRYVWVPSIFQFFYASAYFVLLYYLPIYFQSVDNKTAISSGVLNLPLVLALVLGSIVGGTFVSKTGLAAPLMIFGALLGTVGAGLIYTYDIGTSLGPWIGYQVLYGIAVGLAFQMGITIAQAESTAEDVSSVTSNILFFQTIGGAFAISAAQSAFVSRLIITLRNIAPEINAQQVVGTGATQIRHVFPANEIPSIVRAYMAGIKVSFILVVAVAGASTLVVGFIPKKRLNLANASGAMA